MFEPFPNHGGCNMLVKENRVGKFPIAEFLIETLPADILLRLMSNFVIVRAESIFAYECIEYTAYSPLFRQIDKGSIIPTYMIQIDADTNITAHEVTDNA